MIPIRAKCLDCGEEVHTKVGWMNVGDEWLADVRARGDEPIPGEPRGNDVSRIHLRLRHLRHADTQKGVAVRCAGRLGLAAAAEALQRALPQR